MGKVMFLKKGDIHTTPSFIPTGYTQLEYIESTGTQYIDTEYKANQNTRIVMDVEPSDNGVDSWFFDGRHASKSNSFGVYVQYSLTAKPYYSDYNTSRLQLSGVAPTERILIDFNKNVITIGDVTVTHNTTTFQSSYNTYLLCVNTAGSTKGYLVGKLYSCQIYDNDTLVRDFIPCMSNTGETGLYDRIGKKFYSNAGTDVFYSNLEHPPVVDVGTVWLYTSNNSFTVPITGKYQVEMHGGGGGGGGAGNKTTGSYVLASGYGGGGSGQLHTLQLTKGDSYAIVVGVGGQAGIASKIYTEWEDANSYSSSTRTAATAGGTGGTTSFGSYSVKGGNGGSPGTGYSETVLGVGNLGGGTTSKTAGEGNKNNTAQTYGDGGAGGVYGYTYDYVNSRYTDVVYDGSAGQAGAVIITYLGKE